MSQVIQDTPMQNRWAGLFKSPIDWLLLVGILGLAPLIWSEARSLWVMKHYQFFPLAWAAFVGVVYLRGHVGDTQSDFRKVLGWSIIVFTVVISVMAALMYYPKLGQLAAIFLILGWMLLRLGGNPWFQCLAWVTLLVITIRLPVTLDQMLIHRLQAISSISASHLLDLTGIPHLATGNVIEIKPGKLFVEEACSGVDSFYALTAVALMLAVWQQRGFLVSLLTIASVPLWAWFGNVIRLYLLAFLYNNYDLNLTEGWMHTVFGLIIFAVAFGGLLSMQEALTRLLWPLPGGDSASDWAPRFYNWAVTWPESGSAAEESRFSSKADGVPSPRPSSPEDRGAAAWVLPGIAIVAFLATGFITAGPALGIGTRKKAPTATFDRGAVDVTFAANNLPADLGGMALKNFEISHRERSSMFGAHSATWLFQDQNREVILSLDFAFTVFHPLEVCYQSVGSTVLGDIVQYEMTPESNPIFLSEVRLRDMFGEDSYLLYTEFNEDGVSAERMEVFAWNTFLNKGFFEKSIGPLFQLQLLVTDAGTLQDVDRDRYRTILSQAREILLPKVQELTNPGAAPSATGNTEATTASE